MGAYSIVDFGAVQDANNYPFRTDVSLEEALRNHRALVHALQAANAAAEGEDKTVLIPADMVFHMVPSSGLPVEHLQDVTLQIDGIISARTEPFGEWTKLHGTDMAQDLLSVANCSGFTIIGTGRVLGNGHSWWWHVLLHGDKKGGRPKLLSIQTCRNLYITGVSWENSPRFHLWLFDVVNATVENMQVLVDVDAQKKMWTLTSHLPVYPLNTDGIDPAGKNITIRNVNITSHDDAIAVKPCRSNWKKCVYSDCTTDVFIENVRTRYSTGMTIGTVPPNRDVHCVRNVTFRNVVMEHPYKGIYIKTNPGSGTGIIDNIMFENVQINNPLWWGVYIGPQQQQQPGRSSVTGCDFLFPLLPFKKCPTEPSQNVTISNIHMKNVHVDGAVLSPGMIRCDASNPCRNITFEGSTLHSRTGYPYGQQLSCDNADVWPRGLCHGTPKTGGGDFVFLQ